MTYSPSISNPLPPRLSMDEYADFVEASLRECNRAHATRQKEVEERIRVPFRMSGDTPPVCAGPAVGDHRLPVWWPRSRK